MPNDSECACVNDLEKLYLADEYAELMACEFVESFGEVCPPMMDYVIERTIVRLVHLAIMNRDDGTEASERKTLDATAEYIFRLSKTAPATLKIIMDDAARKGEPANASN